MSAIVTLTTDFGLADAYVAAMKGVILGINPQAKIIDVCHSIKPQNIAQAAFVLSTAYPYFPKKTLHLVVVDPGVGAERRAIILRTPVACFIAPDNGVLSYVIGQSLAKPVMDKGRVSLRGKTKPGADIEVVAITNPKFWRSPVSATFHGRDIFAPVAAVLSLGFPPIEFGEPIDSIRVLPLPRPSQRPDGTLVGHILHVDNFGNLITDIKSDDLSLKAEHITIEVGGQLIFGLSGTYAEGSGLLALIGSSDYLEVSLKGGSASSLLDARVGDEVRLGRQSGGS
jgi:S-adenosylmethionine hydrolase